MGNMAESTTKSIADIPLPYRQLFESYTNFNAVQSLLYDAIFRTNKSVVLSAPTGSGKTAVFEMAIVKMLHQYHTENQQQQQENVVPPKAIYVAPIKALCSEKFNDWQQRFAPLQISCCQITGDSPMDQMLDVAALRNAQIIVTTPEKWDSMTRRWREYKHILEAVRLFMIDEVHLLNEDVRGPILEAIVARMKTMPATAPMQMRFLIASATIPNVEDLSLWLQRDQKDDVVHYKFNDSDRPVPLEKHVIAVNSKSVGFQFDLHLNYKLADIIRQYSQRMATLIFCNSRKSAELSANVLERNGITSYFFDICHQKRSELLHIAAGLGDARLSKLVAIGIAYHHAGLSYADRQVIEDGFRRGLIMVLISTNTLAMGVNLPAHLVVIKSTEYYCRGSFVEYAESTLQQMIGRAGRPQYDTKGVAVILTHSRNALKYDRATQPVESHLHKHLAEHLNSEIALHTIANLGMAMRWMRATYLYVRATKSPQHYGIAPTDGRHAATDVIERRLEEMCVEEIEALCRAGLVRRHAGDVCDLATTAYGKLMAKYCLSFDTMKLFGQVAGDESLLDTLMLLVRCQEFDEFAVRVNEKRVLNELNKTPVRFPHTGRIKTKQHKILCLIQSVFGNLNITMPGLTLEALKIVRVGERVAKCLLEYLRLGVNSHTANAGGYNVVLSAVTIAKCFHAKLWENSVFASKQLRKIGTVYTSLLADAGKTTLKSIAQTDARTIELILNKAAPFGDEVLQNLLSFPEYELQVSLNANNSELKIAIRQLNVQYTRDLKCGNNAVVIVGDTTNKLHLFDENLDNVLREKGVFERTISVDVANVEEMFVHVVHKLYVGVDVEASAVINSKASPSTNIKVLSTATRQKRHIQTKLPQTRRKATANPSMGKKPPLKRPTRESLKDFQYKKPKLQAHSEALAKESNDVAVATDVNHNSSSSFAQMKLTDYYLKRKANAETLLVSHRGKTTKLDNATPPNERDKVSAIAIEAAPKTSTEMSTVADEAAISKSPLKQNEAEPDYFSELDKCLQEMDERATANCNAVEKMATFQSIAEEIPLFSGSVVQEMAPYKQLDLEPFQYALGQRVFKEDMLVDNSPPEPSLHWYKVCRAFMRLKPEQQHYNNFQRISQRQHQKTHGLPQMQTSTPLHLLDDKRGAYPFKADLETSFSTIAKTNECRHNLNTSVSSSVGRTRNPYRLQLFKTAANDSVANQSFEGRQSVDDINRNVMTDLLRAKTQECQVEQQQQHQHVEQNPNEFVLPLVSKVGPKKSKKKQLEDFKTFEEYCEYFMGPEGSEII